MFRRSSTHMEKYSIVRELVSSGSSGDVCIARRKSDRKLFVIKRINLSSCAEKERQAARQEVALLSSFNHPNIIQYVESFVKGGSLYMVMEYCEGGDLYTSIRQRAATNTFYSTEEILEIVVQVALALKYCHARNILHRDLKSQNIFLTKDNVVKLGDFGVARVLTAGKDFLAKTLIGTPMNLSPEQFEEKPYDSKSDMWALGCVLFEITTLRHPFDSKNMGALVYKVLSNDPLTIPDTVSAEISSLITSLLCKEPSVRPSCDDLLSTSTVINFFKKWMATDSSSRAASYLRLPLADSGDMEVMMLMDKRSPSPSRGKLHDDDILDIKAQAARDRALADAERLQRFERDSTFAYSGNSSLSKMKVVNPETAKCLQDVKDLDRMWNALGGNKVSPVPPPPSSSTYRGQYYVCHIQTQVLYNVSEHHHHVYRGRKIH